MLFAVIAIGHVVINHALAQYMLETGTRKPSRPSGVATSPSKSEQAP
jgi:hypothetical protein